MLYLVAVALENGQFMTDKGQITNTYAETYEKEQKREALDYTRKSLTYMISNYKNIQEQKAGVFILLLATIESEEAEEIKELLFRAEITEAGTIGIAGREDYISDFIQLIRKEALNSGLAVLSKPYTYEQEKDLERLTKPYRYDA